MISESRYNDMKSKIPEIKQLFQTRRYTQCATICKQLLTQSNDGIHPIHEAYLNFYIALSHDTMGREAGMRNRLKELDLAEKHYIAAIAILTPPESQKLEDIEEVQSPTSLHSGGNQYSHRRASDAGSLDSDRSTSTDATSLNEYHEDFTDCKPISVRFNSFERSLPSRSASDDYATGPQPTKSQPASINVSQSKAYTQHEQFSTDLSAFMTMMRSHLTGIRQLKDSALIPVQRYSFTRSRGSSFNSRPASRDSAFSESEMDRIRWNRKSTSFRPRFDPTTVRQLCTDALSDL
ncbi:hypothetical protein CC78DRAFT_164215 [Lojkania enalia]|uniref:Uncharacterized protein n=1 Tax=Lojkania enalia TaxID=147567 RepID=A0A9P4N8Q7_9PLEO|nr:hypothetical protein CC78DRAFT_164215 [Didymosphaeria enalia]